MAARSQAAPARLRLLLVAGLLVLTGISALAMALRNPGEADIARWWPASATALAAALFARKREVWYVLAAIVVVTALGSLGAGRLWQFSLIGGVGSAIEAWLIAAIISGSDGKTTLKSVTDVGRFLIANVAGTVVGAVIVAGGAQISGLDFAETFVLVAASHGVSIVILVPIFIINRVRFRVSTRPQTVAVSLALAAAVVAAFFPGSPAPLTFLPVPILVWAALSQSMLTAAIQVAFVAAGVSTLTLLGGGAFAYFVGPFSVVAIPQLYAFTLAVLTLVIGAATQERRVGDRRAQALLALVQDAFERGPDGFALLEEREEGIYQAVDINAVAPTLLPGTFEDVEGKWQLRRSSRLFDVVSEMPLGATRILEWGSGSETSPTTRVTLLIGSEENDGRMVVASIKDLAPLREAEERLQLQIERERATIDALRRLNQQKNDFVASVSHELRTPITSILGYAEEMRDDDSDDKSAEYLEVIQRNALRLLGVVNDVLLVAQRNSDTDAEARRNDVVVVDAVGKCISDLGHQIRSKRIHVDAAIDRSIRLHVSESDFERVLSNLMTNAIKFSPSEGKITLSAIVDGAVVVIGVEDEGPGISVEDRDRIFDPFYRSPQATRDGVPGTGLGLPIARELVQSMGGTISLRADLSAGTCIEVRIPRVMPAATR
nr:ATP-binding protein [Microbacterium endophyticum]